MINQIIGQLRDEGKTIILSTHQMNKVEELCDRVLMINHGREVLYGDLLDIKGGYKKHSVLLDVEGTVGHLLGVMEQKPEKGLVELVLSPETTPQNILDQLKGRTINHFEIRKPSLNEIFLQIAGENDE